MELVEIELAEVCGKLPAVQPFVPEGLQAGMQDCLFICACGFEKRTLSMPSALSACGKYRVEHSIVLIHETNTDENRKNQPKLTAFLERFSDTDILHVDHNDDDFVSRFEEALTTALNCPSHSDTDTLPQVTVDITGLSGRMLFSVMKLLSTRKIRLRILYTEAAKYHPTRNEYKQHPEEWTADGEGISAGILKVREANLYPGLNVSELPTTLVAFPTFKPERIRSVQAELKPARTFWVVGIPHAPKDRWRSQAMREINCIPEDDHTDELSAFEYIEVLALLERLRREHGDGTHFAIAPHGSKLNNVGVALFCLLRQDVGLWFSTPQRFNASQYTGSARALWQIDFGELEPILTLVRSCGKLRLEID